MVHDGLWCAFENWHMGEAAEHIAGQVRRLASRPGPLLRLRATSEPRRPGTQAHSPTKSCR